MNKWKPAKLGDIAETCLGKMLDKEKNKGVLQPYIANVNLRWGGFDLTNLSTMRFEESESERYGLKPGDLVVCEGGEPGRCAIWRGEIPEMKIQKAIHRVRTNKDYSNEFLFYRFLLAGRNGELKKHFIGSTIKHLTGFSLKQVEFDFPSLTEQQGIAKVLSALDAKIELNNRINAELEGLAKLLYDYWFVQFDFPMTAAQAAALGKPHLTGHPYRASGGKMIYNETLKRDIPEGWATMRFDSFCENFDSKRIPLSKAERSKRQGPIPYYGATGVMDFVDDHIFEGEYVLVAEDGSVMDKDGFPIIQFITEKSWVNNHAHVLRANEPRNNEFLLLSIARIPVINIMTGSIQKKITQDNLNALLLLRPSTELLEAFASFAIPIRQQRVNLQKQNQELTQLRDWLLPMLMNGQVTVGTNEC